MTWKSAWYIIGIRSKVWWFRQYRQLHVLRIQSKTKFPLSHMPSVKTGVRETADKDCWFNYHHHYPTPLHDYITKHGLSFYKPLGGEPCRLLIPSVRSSLLSGLLMLQYLVYTVLVLSLIKPSIRVKVNGRNLVHQGKDGVNSKKAVEIYRPQTWPPFTLKGPREHSEMTGIGRWSWFMEERTRRDSMTLPTLDGRSFLYELQDPSKTFKSWLSSRRTGV